MHKDIYMDMFSFVLRKYLRVELLCCVEVCLIV